MITWLIPNFIGGKNNREINRIRPTVARINEIERTLRSEPPGHLCQLTANWREHLSRYLPLETPSAIELRNMDAEQLRAVAERVESRFSALRSEFSSLPARVEATATGIAEACAAFQRVEERFAKSGAKYLERILPDACAVVKNAARRLCGSHISVNGKEMTWDMVHFDVQLIGGIALHRGLIAEMQTGEGKTLVATLPVYLNALTGLGVHVVTVNDYLAARDSEWMGALYRSLGLSVGCILGGMSPAERRAAYRCDITYGTSSEFGFDYLRDNGTALHRDELVQRGHHMAVIDEVDSILIDDARTPLIISTAAEGSSDLFGALNNRVEQLVKRQTDLCNRFAAEAESHLAQGDHAAAGLSLLKLKLGQPGNRKLLRFMENHELRRLLEKTELAHQRGSFRKDIKELRERLFYVVDEKTRDVDLVEMGRRFLAPDDPDYFTLPDVAKLIGEIASDPGLSETEKPEAMRQARAELGERAARVHAISQLLKAHCLHERDVHYVVRDGKVVIIDEGTGREMDGRRWSDGLHQAVEAKERVAVEKETRTCATITLQNYFRLYRKLAGMTGTAETEAAEFHDIYQLDVLPIPTHSPNIRVDENDQIYGTRREKYAAVVERIRAAHATGQPVLAGTASVEASETLSRLLRRAGIPHSVLNAKFHEQEAEIVSRAGLRGAVTVATNMAGRGTDIKLGQGVAELGGLLVIGTERHSSRRVDRQLRGRCSRQGDPGRTRFFISLEDDLMRHHAAQDLMAGLIRKGSGGPGPATQSLGRLVGEAQTRVEQRDYRARKQVLDFDDVMNLQREIVYGFRTGVLLADDARALVADLMGEALSAMPADPHEEDEAPHDQLAGWLRGHLLVPVSSGDLAESGRAANILLAEYENRMAGLPPEQVDRHARLMLLTAIDNAWMEHLELMDDLREGVFLRAQGQKDPLVEYKNEAYSVFSGLMDRIRRDALVNLFRAIPMPAQREWSPDAALASASSAASSSRNAPCPCGSGKKYKRCCGNTG